MGIFQSSIPTPADIQRLRNAGRDDRDDMARKSVHSEMKSIPGRMCHMARLMPDDDFCFSLDLFDHRDLRIVEWYVREDPIYKKLVAAGWECNYDSRGQQLYVTERETTEQSE